MNRKKYVRQSNPSKLPAIVIHRLRGTESFQIKTASVEAKVLDFWQWSCSNLLGNTLRGQLAEYIVGLALGCVEGTRQEWDAVDLLWTTDTDRSIRIEVKSAAYLQSWEQTEHSAISFDIAPKRSWDEKTNTVASEFLRSSDVYVFCLLHHKDKSTVNPLDLSQWSFYALSTDRINKEFTEQQRIALGPLERLHGPPFGFAELPDQILRDSKWCPA